MVRGRTTPQAPSPFLEEIGKKYVAVEDVTPPVAPAPKRRAKRRAQGGFYEDAEDRAAIEAAEDAAMAFPPEYEFLKVGSTVRHPKFGLGRVTRLRQPWPETRADIVFETVGKKTIVLSKVSLELV
jgi:DNA helicase-2/ATP-dependent DNA helicase PcrA